jgi:hypothetical protein
MIDPSMPRPDSAGGRWCLVIVTQAVFDVAFKVPPPLADAVVGAVGIKQPVWQFADGLQETPAANSRGNSTGR